MKIPIIFKKNAKISRKNGLIYSPSRHISRVSPPPERTVALTFDDGPTSYQASQTVTDGVTENILNTLREYGARATFNVFGSTAANYPDTSGAPGTPYAFGRQFEHLPAFGLDDMAGAEACPELVRRIAREGHELGNHTRAYLPYEASKKTKQRLLIATFDDAVDDARALHDYVYEQTHFNMRFFRPPAGLIHLPEDKTAYDVCEALGYHYLDPIYDFGSAAVTGDNALKLLRDSLERDPNSLSGAIVAQRDGINWRREDLTGRLLRKELELLEKYGYRVIPVGELLEQSPFEDMPTSNYAFEAVRRLDIAGFVTGFRNNRFYPERELTWAEAALLIRAPSPDRREIGVMVERKNTLRPREIAAMAEEVFRHVLGAPKSAKRADVAVWLAAIADVNGFLRESRAEERET